MTPPIAIVLGTRPEIIKLGQIIELLGDRAQVIHTGQHFDLNMSRVFFEAFALDEPQQVLGIGGVSRGQQIGGAISALSTRFETSKPAAVVVQGDTNSALAGAVAANAASVPVAHVEAGLRSYDRRMPEEHNRVIVDHLSDLCFAPTETSKANLEAEGIPAERIHVTGNTVVGALQRLLPNPTQRQSILERHGLDSSQFVLSTFHRPENVDEPETLTSIVHALRAIDLPVVLPAHPRTIETIRKANIDVEGIRLIEPLGYTEFLALLAESRLAVSDSGGLQEEVSVLKRPMVVVRNSTERPEVLGTFCTLVKPGDAIVSAAEQWLSDDLQSLESIESPYGTGTAAEHTVTALLEYLDI